MSTSMNADTVTPPQPISPFTGTQHLQGPPFWIVDGQAYDFREWMQRHPGGSAWFVTTQGRDISALFHSCHRDPERLRKMLARYRVDTATPADVLPTLGVPPFLIPDGFHAARDLPRFDFNRQGNVLGAIQRNIAEKLPPAVLRRYDLAFDLFTAFAIVIHLAALAGLVTGVASSWASGWALVLVLVLTRTALAGAGHYHLHRRKRAPAARGRMNYGQSLFDINYVGTCLIGIDGHVLLHHPYLGSGGDVKRTFFSGMLQLHPALRIVGYTLHKLGICLTGMVVRGYEVNFIEFDRGHLRTDFWLIRLWLLLELVALVASGHTLAWLAQFVISLWLNTFLVVASHDFEGSDGQAVARCPPPLRDDWAARQICESFDLSVVGSRWVDVFLTAGLSPHRVHHVLPAQRSGFANIASETVVQEVCEEYGIRWERPRNLITERLPAIIKHYMFSPPMRPARRAPPGPPGRMPPPGAPPPPPLPPAPPGPHRPGALGELAICARYIAMGWRGIGAV
jgi:hypothetical protein